MDNSIFDTIVSQIMPFSPEKIILFGSQAKGTASSSSDIDICIIASHHPQDRRHVLADLYYNVNSEKPIDFLLYSPSEWKECISDRTSFAYQINSEGRVLYGG